MSPALGEQQRHATKRKRKTNNEAAYVFLRNNSIPVLDTSGFQPERATPLLQ